MFLSTYLQEKAKKGLVICLILTLAISVLTTYSMRK